jgi:DNA-directed RNA polymerase subunit F
MGDAMNIEDPASSIGHISPAVHRWRMAFFGLVILLAGVIIGIALTLSWLCYPHRTRMPGPEFAAETMLHRIEPYLHLSPEQTKKMQPLLRKHMQKLQQMREDIRTEITEQLRQMNTEISSILDEHQKQLWREHLQRLEGQLRPGPGGPGGPQRQGFPGAPRGPGPHRRRGGNGSFGENPSPVTRDP